MDRQKAIELLSQSANAGVTTLDQDFKDAEKEGILALQHLETCPFFQYLANEKAPLPSPKLLKVGPEMELSQAIGVTNNFLNDLGYYIKTSDFTAIALVTTGARELLKLWDNLHKLLDTPPVREIKP